MMLACFHSKIVSLLKRATCPGRLFVFFYMIPVSHVVLAAEGMRPIRGPIEPTYWEENQLWLSPLVVVLAVSLLVLFWIFIKIRSKPKIVPPDITFRQELLAIEELAHTGEMEEIPSRLWRVFREYLEAKTDEHLGDKTREEFLQWVESNDAPALPVELVPDLREFMGTLEQAKFSGESLSKEEIDRLLGIGIGVMAVMERHGEGTQ